MMTVKGGIKSVHHLLGFVLVSGIINPQNDSIRTHEVIDCAAFF